MSDDIPPIPPELCGIQGCVFLPHRNGTPHTWATNNEDERGCGMSDSDAAERVEAFLDVFESATTYGENVYVLARIEGDYALSVSDLRELVQDSRRRRW